MEGKYFSNVGRFSTHIWTRNDNKSILLSIEIVVVWNEVDSILDLKKGVTGILNVDSRAMKV